ncbi:MAG: hypothetical protein ACT4OZ_13050 [Gemmatimonadota bacterium]
MRRAVRDAGLEVSEQTAGSQNQAFELAWFLLIDAMEGVDTIAGLMSTELVSVWGIFLMRQFLVSLPAETEDAARIDGAGEWTIFREGRSSG